MLRRIDPVLLLLFFGLLIFTVLLMACEKLFYNDAQIFQVISMIVGGFSGSLFTRLKPDPHQSPPADHPTPPEAPKP